MRYWHCNAHAAVRWDGGPGDLLNQLLYIFVKVGNRGAAGIDALHLL
jgi:hypothetical protein